MSIERTKEDLIKVLSQELNSVKITLEKRNAVITFKTCDLTKNFVLEFNKHFCNDNQ